MSITCITTTIVKHSSLSNCIGGRGVRRYGIRPKLIDLGGGECIVGQSVKGTLMQI